MPKFHRKRAILFKLEVTPGTDSVPVVGVNAGLVRNFEWTPMQMTLEDRELVRPYMGHAESIVVAKWGEMEFDVEIAGAGGAGTAPKWGPLMRGCGRSETINAGVSVVYAPISSAQESLSVYGEIDGILHKGLYSRGSVRRVLDANKIPYFRFSFKGLYVPATDTANLVPVYTGWQKPVAVNKDNTTLTLHGIAAKVEALTIDDKGQVEYRNLINEESVQYVDRKPDGSISMEMTTVAAKDWMATIAAATTGAMEVVHGTLAGNIVEFDNPAVQLLEPRYVPSQGIVMLNANLKINPSSGNDEDIITVR